jgi:hypothetical protein
VAAEVDHKIAQEQLTRGKQLFNQGVVSLVELERRTAQNNKALAILTEKQQKLLNTRQEINIIKIDINSARQEADDKIFNSRSEIASSRGDIAGTTGEVAKNRNILANYISRGNQKWLIAPQDGQIIKAKKSGINEIVKEGEMIVEMVPTEIDHAIELFIEPMDLMLINPGQKVRMIFDGFPAIVFSGWPDNSYGTFGGEISMVENNRNENGKFRILVIPDRQQKAWPAALKTGTGARGFALLTQCLFGMNYGVKSMGSHQIIIHLKLVPKMLNKMQFKRLIYTLFLPFLIGNANAQEKNLSIENTLDIVRKYHPVIKQSFLQNEMAKNELRASRGIFDPSIQINTNEKTYNNKLYYKYNTSELKIPLWYGIDIKAGTENNIGERIDPTLTRNKSAFVGVSMDPFRGIIVDKRNAVVKQAKNFVDLTKNEQLLVVNDVLLEATSAYWNWVNA